MYTAAGAVTEGAGVETFTVLGGAVAAMVTVGSEALLLAAVAEGGVSAGVAGTPAGVGFDAGLIVAAGGLKTGKPSAVAGALAGTAMTDAPGDRDVPGADAAGSSIISTPGALAITVGLATDAAGAFNLFGAETVPARGLGTAVGELTVTAGGLNVGKPSAVAGNAVEAAALDPFAAEPEAVTGFGREGTVTVAMPGEDGWILSDMAGDDGADEDGDLDGDEDAVPDLPDMPEIWPEIVVFMLARGLVANGAVMFGKPCKALGTGKRLYTAECPSPHGLSYYSTPLSSQHQR